MTLKIMRRRMLMKSIICILIFSIIYVFLTLLFSIKRKKANGNIQYDEMQLFIRAEGYKRSYFILILSICILFAIKEFNISVPFDDSFGLFAAMMISVTFFAVYAIINDAFFSINDKGIYYTILIAVLVITNGISIMQHISDGSILNNGVITASSGGMNIITFIGFLPIFIALIIKNIKYKSELKA